jgi:hypothetical protein
MFLIRQLLGFCCEIAENVCRCIIVFVVGPVVIDRSETRSSRPHQSILPRVTTLDVYQEFTFKCVPSTRGWFHRKHVGN